MGSRCSSRRAGSRPRSPTRSPACRWWSRARGPQGSHRDRQQRRHHHRAFTGIAAQVTLPMGPSPTRTSGAWCSRPCWTTTDPGQPDDDVSSLSRLSPCPVRNPPLDSGFTLFCPSGDRRLDLPPRGWRATSTRPRRDAPANSMIGPSARCGMTPSPSPVHESVSEDPAGRTRRSVIRGLRCGLERPMVT